MKTALDWLIEQMPYEFRANHTQELFKQAKELEKEQIIDAYCEGFKEGSEGNRIMPEEYYYDLYNQFIKKITITEFNQKQHIIDIMKADEDDGLYNQSFQKSDKEIENWHIIESLKEGRTHL